MSEERRATEFAKYVEAHHIDDVNHSICGYSMIEMLEKDSLKYTDILLMMVKKSFQDQKKHKLFQDLMKLGLFQSPQKEGVQAGITVATSGTKVANLAPIVTCVESSNASDDLLERMTQYREMMRANECPKDGMFGFDLEGQHNDISSYFLKNYDTPAIQWACSQKIKVNIDGIIIAGICDLGLIPKIATIIYQIITIPSCVIQATPYLNKGIENYFFEDDEDYIFEDIS